MTDRAAAPAAVAGRRASLLEPLFIGLAALAVRVAYLLSIRGTPITDVLLIDSETYDRFARLILQGRFHGEQVYSMNVLYPYFLAAIYKLFAGSPWGALGVQAVLDSASGVLTWWIGRRCFGPATGRVAGLLTALYGPMVFYSGTLLTPTLITFLGLLSLALLVRYRERPGFRVAAGAGIAIGLAVLARGNNLLFVLLAPAWFAVVGGARSERVRHGLAFAGAALAIGVAATLRNYLAEGRFVPIAANYAAFYIGHNPAATGLYAMPGFTSSADFQGEVLGSTAAVAKLVGHPVTLAESSRVLFAEGWRFLFTHPLDELRLAMTKVYYFFNRTESPTNLSYYLARDFSAPLRWLPFGFGLVAPLGLLGMWLARAEWRRHLVLHLYALVGLATAVLFFVSAEYRLPVVPVFAIFAAYALVATATSLARSPAGEGTGPAGRRAARRGAGPPAPPRRAATAAWLPALLLLPPLLLACNLRSSRLEMQSLKRVDYLNLGTLYRMRGDLDRARTFLEHSLAIDPNYRPAREALAAVYQRTGDTAAALRLARGLGVAPGTAAGGALQDSVLEVARVFEERRYGEALAGFQRLQARAEAAGDSTASLSLMNNVGLCYYRMRDLDPAAATFERIIDRDPRYVKAHSNLARVRIAQGRIPEAIRQFEEAQALDPADQRIAAELARLRGK